MTDRDVKVAKVLADVRFVQTLIGPHESNEATLAAEVIRLYGMEDRARTMIVSWREVAKKQRECAVEWRTEGESFAWHAIRADERAELLETQAKLLESILNTL